jgi:hypothetical protein
MQKQLRIITRQRMAVDPFSTSFLPIPSLPRLAFSKHFGRVGVYRSYRGTRVLRLGSTGWYVHCFLTGRRWLSALPF